MADTVTTETVYNGRKRKVTHLTSLSDGTGESTVTKIDISTFTFGEAQVPTYTAIDRVEGNIQGFTSVFLTWDHTTPDEIVRLGAGANDIDFYAYGGKIDPRTSGGTGDIKLTTEGETAGASYDIRIFWRPKA